MYSEVRRGKGVPKNLRGGYHGYKN